MLDAGQTFLRQCMKLKDKYPIQSKDEEDAMIAKYKNDRTQLNQRLIMHNMRIAFSMARKYAKHGNHYEDLISRAMEGLAEAANRFDPSLGCKFSTTATIWVFKYISKEWYTSNKQIDDHAVSLNKVIADGEHDEGMGADSSRISNVINSQVSLDSYYYGQMAKQDVAKQIDLRFITDAVETYMQSSKFDKLDRDVYDGIFKRGLNIHKLSAEIGMPVQEVNERKWHVRNELKQYMADKFNINHATT